MALRLLAYVPLLVVASASTLGLAVYTWRHRDAPGARALTGLLVGMAAWAGFYALGLVTQSVALRLVWLRFNWLGSAFVPMFWLLFALEYSGRTEWITRWTVGGLAAVPVATVALAWTSLWHDLMWSNVRLRDLGRVTMLRYDDGLWYTVFDIYTYAVIAVATAVLVSLVIRHRDMYTDQAVALLAGSFFPAVGYLTTVLGFVRPGVDPTPLTFPVTGLLFGYVIFRGNLFDALTTTAAVGEEAAVDAMGDGVVVVDDAREIIETNPAARSLLGGDLVGRPVETVPPLADIALDGTETTTECRNADQRVLEVQATPIRDPHDREIGHSLVVRDITERRRARERLQVSNRILRHNLRNKLTVVDGNADHIERHATDETVADAAASIRSAADSLSESGEKVRFAVSALDGHQRRTPVDIARIARTVVSEFDGVGIDAPDTATALAVGGVDRAIAELVENSRQHAGSDPAVRVSVSVLADTVQVVVRDDGPGVPAQERRVIQGGTESQLEHGSGAGLWLVRWVVKESGGTLSFDHDDGAVVELGFQRPDR